MKERKSKSQNLFASERSDFLSTSAIQKVVKKAMKFAGLPPNYSVHSLRHTYATLLYKSSGNNLRLVQQQLGHSSVQTTTVYANVTNEDVKKADNNQLPAHKVVKPPYAIPIGITFASQFEKYYLRVTSFGGINYEEVVVIYGNTY